MSFSAEVKNELAKIGGEESCCTRAELAGIMAFAGVFEGVFLRVNTENAAVARRTFSLLKEFFGAQAESRAKKMGSAHLYSIRIGAPKEMLANLGIQTMPTRVSESMVKRDCCARAFVRGAFMGGGSITTPSSAYHIEIATRHIKLCEDLKETLARFGLRARSVERKGYYVVYLKNSESIGDMLALMGAHNIMMDFLNVKIMKEMRNNANRMVNCETANVDKSVAASMTQVKAIREIEKKIGLDVMPAELSEVARLRLKFPEDSLKDLGERISPPITKSAVNHRIRRIMEIYEQNKE